MQNAYSSDDECAKLPDARKLKKCLLGNLKIGLNGKRQIARWNIGEERGKEDKDRRHSSSSVGYYGNKFTQLYGNAIHESWPNFIAHISPILLFKCNFQIYSRLENNFAKFQVCFAQQFKFGKRTNNENVGFLFFHIDK
jgi:hypothetical protein